MKKSKQVPFSKLGAAAMRVAIARDVIDQIKARAYEMETGTWAEVRIEESHVENFTQFGQDILLNGPCPIERKVVCTVCGIGAAFVSSIRLANKAFIKGGRLDGFDEASKQLRHFFPKEQLNMIEAAFEMGQGSRNTSDGNAEKFGENYDDDKDRALAIFTNIVNNKGTFKP